jgi:hypothetical protein
MKAADFAAFRIQDVPQHPAAREMMLEVQLVDPRISTKSAFEIGRAR